MKAEKALNRLSKAQVIDLIIWQMFVKKISLEELTERIKEEEAAIIKRVDEHLASNL